MHISDDIYSEALVESDEEVPEADLVAKTSKKKEKKKQEREVQRQVDNCLLFIFLIFP